MTLSLAEIAQIKAHRDAAFLDAAPFWELAREVCLQYNVKASDLSARTRGTAEVCAARDMVCYIAFKRGWTQTKIAKIMRRDHSSVCVSVRRVTQAMEVETPTV